MRDDLIPVEVLGVRRQAPLDQVVVLLLDLAGRRLLPIVVGVTEGSAIATAQQGVVPPRPMTHDLLAAVIEECSAGLDRVEIISLVDGVFHAELVMADETRVDARASDAIAVAVRAGCAVLCAPEVLEESGLEVEEHTTEDEVEEFRAFLDTVSADDFVSGEGAPEEEEGGDAGHGEGGPRGA
ncbi:MULTISPECIES: bifunctional nuclease family protein [unclassified Actinotalea]|uniref:bifunctional nuclease family protein n=1 Tax=unclassified Actinotalea TaxID=2638618 RepID=UPI0015F66994|nr:MULTISPECIES: bifunctional nuclease family protein [unclassified Actinotalea]